MIKINTVTIKTPQRCTIGIEEVSKIERNANGDALIDRMAVKRKIEMKWGALSNSDCSTILTAVSNVFFQVDYPDPESGTEETIVCYASKKTAPMLKYDNSTPYWEELSLTLMER